MFLIFTLLLCFTLFYASKTKRNSILDRFTNKLGVISGFFITAALYLTYLIYESNIRNAQKDITFKIIDRGWININNKFVEYYDLCPNFIDSLYFDWQTKLNENKNNFNKQTNFNGDKWYAVNYLSIVIFQSFEDFLTAYELDETGDYVWICNYIQWVSSPILEDRWSVLKSNYADTTIILGDLLFNNVRNVKIDDYNDIKTLANKIVNSKEFDELMHKRY